ncbi:MAG: transcription-repair coupling factor [Planctomycetota bacterium]|nr:transcription-repair coupling factor [Planctomycetota bacterium]
MSEEAVAASALPGQEPEPIPKPILDVRPLDRVAAFERLVEALGSEERTSAGGLWGSSQAFVLTGLLARAQGPWVVIVSTEAEAEVLADDLFAFGAEPTLFPARETTGRGGTQPDPDSIRRRLQVAQRLSGPPERRPRLLVAPLLSMLQPVPTPRDLEQDFLHLARGARLKTEDVLARLIATGYSRQPLAERPGEVSLRGDILDVFPFAADLPVRVELFDEDIESVRFFDPESQRSVESVERVDLCIAADAGGVEDGKGLLAASMLSPTTVFVEVEPLRVEEQAKGLRIQSSAHAGALLELHRLAERHRRVELQTLPGKTVEFTTGSVQALAVGMHDAPQALARAVEDGAKVVVLCNTPAEEHRFREHLEHHGGPSGLETRIGSVARGFRFPDLGLIVVNHREVAGVLGARTRVRKKERTHRVRALQSFFELKVGDFVVHAVHGLARYAGLARLQRAGGEEEHLQLLFRDDVTLYVPAGRIDLVQRYVGSGGGTPTLDRIGGQAFRKRKEKVERALIDMSAELLEVQARRETQKRPAWKADEELVRDLLDSFPFDDTKDQASADREIAADLAGPRPMDRLLCGDVGFGKTEIAVRAAFRVVSAGAQVALLVPTTVLAQQHYETFRERLADFPVEVGMLNRYVTGKRAKEVVRRVALGQVDILIGTHRILSDDVGFANLGLVIIDEEQRFGVKHKEHFKQLRAAVDVLTLTATPIPRTLHMSLSGLRDISALSEPPEGRQEIETLLSYTDDDALLREALLREKNRGGQVFFLHNRVQSIERKARDLARLVPECTFAIGHGQMTGRRLATVMERFISGTVDVLVATTIIENGIDIPSAGTIVIDEADRFGLSELHQLRGRVGRGRHKSWCHLLVDRNRPIHQAARERLKALEELTRLGAGFQISMKDLELRGAGNILGAEQSGHIAAVGYDMFCRLLKQTVERMTTGGPSPQALLSEVPAEVQAEIEADAVELELGIAAYLPKEWIPAADTRVQILRRLVAIESDADAERELADLRDRYGRVPPEAAALLRQFRLRPKLAALGIRRLLFRDDTYFVAYADRIALEGVLAREPGRGLELRPLERGKAHLVIPEGMRDPEAALDWFEGLLQADSGATKMSAVSRR